MGIYRNTLEAQGIVRYERPPARQRHMGSPQPSHLWTASVSAAKVGMMTYVNAQCRRNHLRVESAWVDRAPDLMFQDTPGSRFGNIGKLKISKSMKISREKIKHCRFLVENIWLPLRLGPTWDPHPRHLWAVRWSGLALERSSNMAAVQGQPRPHV